MTQPTSDIHASFHDNIEAYLAGGLCEQEAADFESHAAACTPCAADLAIARHTDQAMRSLFAPIAPGADFEDRLAAGMRVRPTVRRLHPMVRLAASSVAAAIVLGAVGYYGGRLVDGGHRDRLAAGNLKQLATTAVPYDSEQLPALQSDGQPATQPGFRFHYTTRDGGAAEAKSVDDALKRRVEPNGVRNLRWSGGGQKDNNGKSAEVQLETGLNRQVSPPAGATFDFGLPAADRSKSRGPYFGAEVDIRQLREKTVAADSETQLEITKSLPGHSYYKPGESKDQLDGRNQPGANKAHVAFAESSLSSSAETVTNGPVAAPAQAEHSLTLGPVSSPKKVEQQLREDEAVVTPQAAAVPSPAPVKLELGGQNAGEEPAVYALNPTAQKTTPPAPVPTTQMDSRKIIRTGTMEFEVDSFDSAFMQISKIVGEETGFVASTDSEKLQNGKVKGTITLRCPPEHLDTLVLKLRGLGDLKTQRITAEDVTKQFTDYESQLRAAHAMEDRLLEIIKTGKGTVKDLVEAEKQLGVYRQQIEQIEGELRYMNSQVSLSTLSVSLVERDIRNPFAAVEAEQVNAGIETDDVEHARAEALKLIDDSKGRVIDSELKKLDAGQLAATLVAEVSPDVAGPLGDRLKQLGRVVRWEATRKQTTEGGSGSPPATLPPNMKLQRQPTRFSISLYNLANVAPRQMTNLTLVASDVESAYREILAAVNGNDGKPSIGRIVSSNLSSQKSDQVTGSVTLEVKSDQAAVMETALRAAGAVLHLTVSDSPDQSNVTDAKRGYGISIIAAANVPAREQQTITVASKDVAATYGKLLTLLRDAKSGARITSSQMSEPEEDNITGVVEFEIPLASRGAVEAVLSDGKQSDLIGRNVARSADTENTLADKLHLSVSIASADRLPPRETTRLTLETSDVAKVLESAAGINSGEAHVADRSLNQQTDGHSTAHVVIDVPLSAAQTTLDELEKLGKVASADSARDARVTAGPLARARFEVQIENAQTLVPPQDGIGASITRGLRTALNGLLWSVQMVVVGLVLVVPFALVIWGAWRIIRRGKNEAAANPGGA